MTDALWQLGGWTMIHFLWLGTAAVLVGAALRFACRRAAPGMRYAVSLLMLAALTALPIAIAAWLYLNSPAILAGRTPTASPVVSPNAKTPSQDGSAIYMPPRVVDLAATALEPADPPTMDPAANPSPSPSAPQPLFERQQRGLTLASLVPKLPWLWLIGAPLTFALLASGLVGSERLRRKCTALTEGPAAAACEQLRQAMQITRRVSVAVCDKIAQPVLIGILRPLILLPASALSGWTPAELEMVLVHELAHVRRWDNLVNLLQRIIESALFFHPAVWLISRQVRRDREECCDAVVVSRIERPHDYAALLVSIAAKLQSRRPAALAAASAMADHPLTGRVRRILKLEDEPMWISRRTLGLTVVLPILIAYTALYAGAIAGQDSPSLQTDDPSTAAVTEEGVRDDEASRTPQKFTQPDEPGLRVFKLAHARASMISINLEEYFEKELKAPGDGPKLRFIWDADSNTIVVQNASAEQLETIGKLIETYDQPKAAAKPREGGASVTKAVAAARDFIDPAVELPRLMHEIKRLEGQIAETNKDLVNIEIFKQLALQNPRGSAAVEKAVAAAFEKDPMIAEYQQQLSKLQEAIQQRQTTTRNLNDLQLKKLTRQFDQIQQRMQQYRATAEKSAREQIIKQMPNEAYRAAIVEHKIRYEAATANLKKYQEELGEANRKLDELFRSNSAGLETDEPIYPIVYPVADLETIDFQRWMQLVSSDERIDLRWFDKNKSLVVSAPKSRHEQINALFRETRDNSGDPAAEKQSGYPTEENPFDNVLARRTAPPVVEDKPKEKSPGDRHLQLGDSVMIEVVGTFPDQPINDVYVIEPAGTVALGPAYGRVQIADQSLLEAEAAVEKYLTSTLSDAKVQLTLHQPAATEPQPPSDAKAVYLYDGKPFDEWRSFWKHELNSERRIEAIEALVAFARAGHGREAVEAIFDVAGEYDFKYIDQTPEGQLQERVTKLLTLDSASRIPAADWLPVLMDRLANDPKKWRPLTEWLIGGFGLSPDTRLDPATRKLLLQMAGDPKLAPNAFVLSTLYKHSPQGKDDPELAPLIKAALTGEDVENALMLLHSLRFGSLDAWPEQMDFLFHEDAATRRKARSILEGARLQTRRPVSDRLTAILDDPQRADDHADAIRAMGVLSRNVEGGFHGPDQHWPNEEAKERFRERFAKIVREGRPPELVVPALVAMGIDSVEKVDQYLKSIDASGEVDHRERVEQARDQIEAEAEQVDDRPKPTPQPDEGDMGGGGGGGIF